MTGFTSYREKYCAIRLLLLYSELYSFHSAIVTAEEFLPGYAPFKSEVAILITTLEVTHFTKQMAKQFPKESGKSLLSLLLNFLHISFLQFLPNNGFDVTYGKATLITNSIKTTSLKIKSIHK